MYANVCITVYITYLLPFFQLIVNDLGEVYRVHDDGIFLMLVLCLKNCYLETTSSFLYPVTLSHCQV